SNFAISFSTICILAGGITSFQLGISAIGGAAAGIVWPVGVAFSLIVALCMAEVASAFPTAGGLYHWSAILGGKGWGWATAWFNSVVALSLMVAMLHGAPSLEIGRLFVFADNGGVAGGAVWPAARGLGTMTLLALTWPIYTITGFDASAHTSEETVQAAHNVP